MRSELPNTSSTPLLSAVPVITAMIGLALVATPSGLRAQEAQKQIPAAKPEKMSRSAVTPGTADQKTKAKAVSLRLVPQNPALWGAQASQRILALAAFSDGLERDVTLESRFSVSDERIARVERGRVLALSDGQVALTAHFEGQVARTKVRVEETAKARSSSFARDIGGILTRKGCNSSDCHGGVKGQGGLKLSVNSSHPKEDYRWIVEGGTYQVLSAESAGSKTPRVHLKEPEQSLLLLKSTATVPHGGGERLKLDSRDYQTILNWVRQGARYGDEGDQQIVTVKRVEVFPTETVLDPQGKQQLLVTAFLSNDRQEDITDQVLYLPNNPEVVAVDPDGRMEALKTGETAVMIRAAGSAISARVGVIAKPIENYPVIPRRNFIDEHVFAKLRRFNIIPSEVSSDAEFLRRLCLDLTGTLPPAARVREFLASKDPRKRDKLIETLLNSPEYVDYWSFRFGELFRYHARATQLLKDTQLYGEWLRASIAQNKPFDQIARERITAQGYDGPSRYYYQLRFLTPAPDTIAEQMRVFLGRRLDCARCHNHPFESWSQDQFWGMAAFYGRMVDLRTTVMDDSVLIDYPEMASKVIHPRTKQVVEPRFLDGTEVPESERADLRMKLADWMIAHPYFSETAVDRLWDWFFGRGIVEPVDDVRSTNPPSHPELLAALAREFREHHYDLEHMMRLIVQSRAYQLSGKPNETNRGDLVNFSHAIPRSLDAAVLLDAISTVTGIREDFREPGQAVNATQAPPPSARAIDMLPDMCPSHFMDVYGRNDRATLPEGKPQPALTQALHMMTGATYTDKIAREGGRVDRLFESAATDRQIIEELYLVALSRFPTARETAELEAMIRRQPKRREAIESFAWALISSREFAYKH
ncbi:MAG: DUF1553 domain-containing protein [Acidimicrobiia bacterium]|nr:DUF1553 domain-containing protein [Acidimicrobiia bacterium]